MDATASEKQGARPASDGASTTSSSAPEVRPAPSPELAVAVGSGAIEESGSEDEQVERFYALLANIRALRNVCGAGGSSSRKRPRVAEPPWRPRFRMEDFLDADDDAVSAKKGRKDTAGERQRRPENDDAADGEVVEDEVNDRVSASQSTRACTDSA